MKKFYEVESMNWDAYNYSHDGYFTTYEKAEEYITKQGGKAKTDKPNHYDSGYVTFIIEEYNFIA